MFVNYHHLDSNSGLHISGLANELTRLGVECSVCVPDHKEMAASVSKPTYEVLTFREAHAGRSRRTFDLIHAWTPRQIVRRATQALQREYSCPYLVHLEDNEEYLVAARTRMPFRLLKRLPAFLLDAVIPRGMIHPRRYKDFLAGASGITIIMDTLRAFCPSDVPQEVIWAGYESDLPWGHPPDAAFRRRLGIAEDEFVVAYTGNAHIVNRGEVAGLYRAIDLLNARGCRVTLVRTGIDYRPLPLPQLRQIRSNYCRELGHIPRADLPSVLSIAHVLVQPGKSDPFNDYRFPSKLPEYLASGRPVLLPGANIGRYLVDQEQCVWLTDGDAADIAQNLQMLFSSEALRNRIGAGGREFANTRLQWGAIAAKLHTFYRKVLHETERT